MTVHDVLAYATRSLAQANIPHARGEAAYLVAALLGRDRVWLVAHERKELSAKTVRALTQAIKRRAQREPFAYIVGHKEFYGLDFSVNYNVLIPRPETETLVDQALLLLNQSGIYKRYREAGSCFAGQSALIDVGTGSGAIAVTIANEMCKQTSGSVRIFATDRSARALRVARQNAKKYRVERHIAFLKGDILIPFQKVIQSKNIRINELLIVANLPYIATSELQRLPPEIRDFEPGGALDGGRDGMRYYRSLLKQVSDLLRVHARAAHRAKRPRITLILEIDPSKVRKLRRIASSIFLRPRLSFVPNERHAVCAVLRLQSFKHVRRGT